ncbi:hypothetical protein A9K55_006457 [Cordyceps militaris]|uniref:Uncharacterized protein n=1 Tax=Cordyceps militaris TaxID=73501 RepID=A0A2H4SCX3_CORMI|nr:hypothetical protein A9K55_006457 [Cordyceps militaris]
MAALLAKSLPKARHLPTSRPRCIASSSHAKAQVQSISRSATITTPPPPLSSSTLPAPDLVARGALVRRAGRLSPTYFKVSGQTWMPLDGGQEPVDPNKAKLGKTLPSTHPHLPTVSGRVAYTAALWSSPIAWNRVPLVGNVRLEILAERMTAEPLTFLPRRPGAAPDQLVVRWREMPGGIARSLRLTRGGDPEKAFTGLFIFDFDHEGRVLTHTIETTQAGGDWERGVGAKFVGLTDWLLGGIQREPGGTPPMPMFERRTRT